MSNGNNAADAMAIFSDSASKDALIAELQAQLARFEGDTVVQGQFKGEFPKYKLAAPCFLDDQTLHVEGEIIEYTGGLNLAMVPLNDPAKRAMDVYISELEGGAAERAAAAGRPFTGLSRDMGEVIATLLQDARKAAAPVHIEVPRERGDVEIMPHLADQKARKRGRPPRSSVHSSVAPDGKKQAGPTPISHIGVPPGATPYAETA